MKHPFTFFSRKDYGIHSSGEDILTIEKERLLIESMESIKYSFEIPLTDEEVEIIISNVKVKRDLKYK